MAPPHLDEKVSARPDISPGVIEDHERLLRGLFNPDHVVNGEVVVAAISLNDLRSRGFSVQRMEFVSPDPVQSVIDKFLSRLSDGQERKFEGVARLETRHVREITKNGKQLFVAIDTAMDCNRGHGSIYLSDTSVSEGRARQLRKLLLPLLQDRTSVAEAFGN